MSVTGKVVNDRVVLPPGTMLPEGAAVRIETLDSARDADPLVAVVEQRSRPRPHLPKDYALNDGHYLRGEPRK